MTVETTLNRLKILHMPSPVDNKILEVKRHKSLQNNSKSYLIILEGKGYLPGSILYLVI